MNGLSRVSCLLLSCHGSRTTLSLRLLSRKRQLGCRNHVKEDGIPTHDSPKPSANSKTSMQRVHSRSSSDITLTAAHSKHSSRCALYANERHIVEQCSFACIRELACRAKSAATPLQVIVVAGSDNSYHMVPVYFRVTLVRLEFDWFHW